MSWRLPAASPSLAASCGVSVLLPVAARAVRMLLPVAARAVRMLLPVAARAVRMLRPAAARALVMLLLVAPGAIAASSPFRGGVLEPPRPAPEFTLRAGDGGEFRLSAQRGRVVVMTFGYTFCPDVCPTTLAEFAQVRSRLGPAEKQVQFVFVTVDPERDSSERLRAYTGAFDRRFLGLTGTAGQLEAVRKAYGVTAHKRVVAGTAAAYLVDHSAFIYVVDREGRLRLMFPFGTSIDDMTHDIQLLLGR